MTLTKRQTQIVELIAQGFTAEEVAKQLCRALPTIRRHLQLAHERVGARNTAHLVAIAIKNQFIQFVCVLTVATLLMPQEDGMRRHSAKRQVRRTEETAIVI